MANPTTKCGICELGIKDGDAVIRIERALHAKDGTMNTETKVGGEWVHAHHLKVAMEQAAAGHRAGTKPGYW